MAPDFAPVLILKHDSDILLQRALDSALCCQKANGAGPVSEENEWLTVAEVAAELKVSRSRVRRKIKDGELAAANIGSAKRREYRIKRRDLVRYLEKSKWPPGETKKPSSS